MRPPTDTFMLAKRIGEYLGSGGSTSRLVPQAALLLAIRRHLSETLPDHLQRSFSIANYKQGVVVVITGSNAVAARLRLLEPRMIKTLGERGFDVTGIKVDVQPAWKFAPQLPVKKALFLSPAGAAALAGLARRLPDGRLRAAVAGLASRRGENKVMDGDG